MIRFILPLSLCLSACATAPTIPASPSAVADQTKLDEQIAIGAEALYRGARLLVEPLVDTGLIRGQAAERFRVLNREAFDAVKAVRTAYDTGDSKSYAAAAERAGGAIAKLVALAN